MSASSSASAPQNPEVNELVKRFQVFLASTPSNKQDALQALNDFFGGRATNLKGIDAGHRDTSPKSPSSTLFSTLCPLFFRPSGRPFKAEREGLDFKPRKSDPLWGKLYLPDALWVQLSSYLSASRAFRGRNGEFENEQAIVQTWGGLFAILVRDMFRDLFKIGCEEFLPGNANVGRGKVEIAIHSNGGSALALMVEAKLAEGTSDAVLGQLTAEALCAFCKSASSGSYFESIHVLHITRTTIERFRFDFYGTFKAYRYGAVSLPSAWMDDGSNGEEWRQCLGYVASILVAMAREAFRSLRRRRKSELRGHAGETTEVSATSSSSVLSPSRKYLERVHTFGFASARDLKEHKRVAKDEKDRGDRGKRRRVNENNAFQLAIDSGDVEAIRASWSGRKSSSPVADTPAPSPESDASLGSPEASWGPNVPGESARGTRRSPRKSAERWEAREKAADSMLEDLLDNEDVRYGWKDALGKRQTELAMRSLRE